MEDCVAKLGHDVCNNLRTVWFDLLPPSVLDESAKG